MDPAYPPRSSTAATAVRVASCWIGLLATACTPPSPERADGTTVLDTAAVAAAMPRFEDHPVLDRLEGAAAPIDLDSHPAARRFRDALTAGAARGPNFAGRYTVVAWRCGTACQQAMVVDAASGRVLTQLEAPLGFHFRIDSRLLVLNPPDSLAASPCPTCGTEYHLWTEDGRLLRIPPVAWAGSPAPPPHARGLVARMRAEEVPGLEASGGRVVRPRWDLLIVTARDGTVRELVDESADGDLRSVHRLVGIVDGAQGAVVERILVPEGGGFLLVDSRSGRLTVLDAPPVPDPTGRRFVTTSVDLVAGHAPNRVRVYRSGIGGPQLEWEIEPRDWGARDPVWVDSATVRLERVVVNWATHGYFGSPMLLRSRGDAWVVEPSPRHAADVLLAFFAALATESYPEAARLYGGSYDVLRGWNPDTDPGDLTALWSAACRHNGLVCLANAEVLRTERVSAEETRITVRFLTAAGEPFVLGPCCGATPEEMPPTREFGFSVRRHGDAYRVHDLPVYVP
jgi:hypothetical protein